MRALWRVPRTAAAVASRRLKSDTPAQPTAGAVHSRSTSEISAVKQLEYRDSESLEDPRYSFEIKYSPDFNSLYSSYFQHCNERNQLREVHANQRAQSADSSHKQRYSIENAGSSRFIHSDLQHQQESQIEQTDEYASTVINDYRRSAEEARRCFEYYSKTGKNNTILNQHLSPKDIVKVITDDLSN